VRPPAAAAPAIHRRPTTGPGGVRRARPGPRRVSGPSRRSPTERPAPRRPERRTAVALALIARLHSVLRQRWLDRLIAGRAWIGLVAFALIGIVTLQLGLLKLNGGIGRALEHEALLQRENAALSIENSEMAAGDRVELGAAQIGMELVPSGAVRFLLARPEIDAVQAAARLKAPPPSATIGGEQAQAAGGAAAAQSSGEPSTASPVASSPPAEVLGTATQESQAASAQSTPASESAPGPVDGSGSQSAPASVTAPAGGGSTEVAAGGSGPGAGSAG
jgi:hypothetical protein